jgi:hypothetical protein
MMRNTLGRCSAWLVCVMIAASLCGCADTAGAKKAAPGESVVFGRVAAVYNGKPVENLQGMSFAGSSFVLLKIGESEGKLINLPGDGSFAWALPPGEYMLVEFQYATEGARRALDLRAKFFVPDRPVSMYIGLLRVTYQHGAQAAGLEDDFDGAVAQLQQARPDAPPEIVKSLLEPEEQLGNYSAVVGACDSRWGIKCEDYQYGVRPLDPAHSSSTFTEVPSLTPTFKWSPAGRPGVKYDLVIYQSISCRSVTIMSDRRAGCVVLYREGIDANQFTPDEPLAPGQKYLWSVRFRENDTVSSWSSTGHFTFFLIGFSGASGELFAFRTPAGE